MTNSSLVVLVTGAASGIGRAIALKCASEGARVVIADRNLSAARSFSHFLISQGHSALAVCMDVTDEMQVDSGVSQALDAFGRIDVLVSNAGIQHIDPLDRLSFSDWRKIISVHLDGAFLTTRACLRAMYRQPDGGVVMYMGSVHSKLASVMKAPYVAAKHALLGLARVVAKEGADRGIRSYVICPGFVRTPLVEQQIPEQAERLGISEADVIQKIMLRDTVDGQFTSLEEVADVAWFLASFKGNAMTGQSVMLSHGWWME